MKIDATPRLISSSFFPRGTLQISRLTRKTHVETNRTRARQRTAIMNKIPGATLGTVEKVLKKLYTERVRRILEYGYWSTAAKSNFKDK